MQDYKQFREMVVTDPLREWNDFYGMQRMLEPTHEVGERILVDCRGV